MGRGQQALDDATVGIWARIAQETIEFVGWGNGRDPAKGKQSYRRNQATGGAGHGEAHPFVARRRRGHNFSRILGGRNPICVLDYLMNRVVAIAWKREPWMRDRLQPDWPCSRCWIAGKPCPPFI